VQDCATCQAVLERLSIDPLMMLGTAGGEALVCREGP
jgi:hypothetical protein